MFDRRLFDTTYYGTDQWRLLRPFTTAQPHRLKFTDEDHSPFDVSARVWMPADDPLLMLRIWLPSKHCRHLVLDEVGVVVGDGYERRESRSWEQTLARLVANGTVVV